MYLRIVLMVEVEVKFWTRLRYLLFVQCLQELDYAMELKRIEI